MTEYILVCITAGSPQEAEALAKAVVERNLAACGNVIPDVRSVFWWKDAIETDQEALLLLKSRAAIFPELCRVVKSLHSYDVPEIIALPILTGSDEYLAWIDAETQQE
ncbi:divalent cation tolerance protein CutA [candidate division KSB3 bacterium]|uniref:Divalent cation tolerance protein CutA n=1 Tax=candidate division KSB3 bacterium TaxID=2044937 RepID=A0A9D5JZR0_9BACT|nr:divalent cation tolerance protein CutA [candidate division KSB3 bacterium]MBD3326782.1 divalent cation tolerance protein CutA [candidate division KSB3 bacterium]